MLVFMMAGLSGIVHTARATSRQAGVRVGFELDAIAAAVIGGDRCPAASARPER